MKVYVITDTYKAGDDTVETEIVGIYKDKSDAMVALNRRIDYLKQEVGVEYDREELDEHGYYGYNNYNDSFTDITVKEMELQ